MTRLLLILALCAPLPAIAQIAARFVESAPKDTFSFTNSGCALGQTTLVLDMSGSAGGLIFDTEDGGAGVEVFQPFEAVSGDVASVTVSDGADVLSLSVSDWPEGAEISFTIDVDDVLRHGDLGQTQVSGGEIAGAEVRINSGGASGFAVFDNTRRATIRGFCGA
ncbi:hypothetical protein [Litoreibacter janthinus]|uniref:Aggregation factor core protein MAFp3 n=1 Tax=Litoreibacter janthinus TaxID=670154 RepID=A0A1I6HMV4_9RHOB|nr:hypothetical protein [Litoreibacter janthinus]SFR55799.1 hypothetical protein SAMN04488002_3182 [Litoreibacter janthinus]